MNFTTIILTPIKHKGNVLDDTYMLFATIRS